MISVAFFFLLLSSFELFHPPVLFAHFSLSHHLPLNLSFPLSLVPPPPLPPVSAPLSVPPSLLSLCTLPPNPPHLPPARLTSSALSPPPSFLFYSPSPPTPVLPLPSPIPATAPSTARLSHHTPCYHTLITPSRLSPHHTHTPSIIYS